MNDMPIYKEIKRIACLNAQIARLVKQVAENTDIDPEGIDWESTELVSGMSGRNDGLYYNGHRIATNEGDYFCDQHTGYCEDYYFGWLYFRTDVPGQYVKVHFDM